MHQHQQQQYQQYQLPEVTLLDHLNLTNPLVEVELGLFFYLTQFELK